MPDRAHLTLESVSEKSGRDGGFKLELQQDRSPTPFWRQVRSGAGRSELSAERKPGMKPRAILFLALSSFLLSGLFGQSGRANAGSLFPEPKALEPDIQFWMRIYAEVDSQHGLLHDSRDLSIVYEVVSLPPGSSKRTQDKLTETKKRQTKQILEKLGKGRRKGLSSAERRVLAAFPSDVSNRTLAQAARRVRFQLGQADQFKAGIIRSGAYLDHIHATLDKFGLPRELAALPHVESSYNPRAYSRVGASGLWQFTRSTGRRYMRIDSVVDERRDPHSSTIAAARLLMQNHHVTKSWPLAITAYNHGASGMRRAVGKLGTRDITTIVRKHRSRTFGFASRNFYVEFLAAVRVSKDPERYFGPLVRKTPTRYESHNLAFYTTPNAISRALGVKTAHIKEANPSLLTTVWQGQKRIPKGFDVRIPRGLLSQPMKEAMRSVPHEHRYASQTRDREHRVRRGETLSEIARRYSVSTRKLQDLNHLRNRHHIRIGQKLKLPVDTQAIQTARYTPETKPTAVPVNGIYTVAKGDTLSAISKRFGTTVGQLIFVNGLENRHRINQGQQLLIPTSPISGPTLTAQATDAASWLFETVLNIPDSPPEDWLSNLLADPSDYSVAEDSTIEVQASETLGHYADWLDLPTQRLRSLNGLRFHESLAVHRRIRLDLSRVPQEQFERKRTQYHEQLQAQFFSDWKIQGTQSHTLRRGDSLWMLAHKKFDVPVWLLQQYNPDIDFVSATAGTRISVPILEKRKELNPS